ncbi:hypothetical protein M405DRAFT_828055 [Rhizopogon salebrosus TDB-379]|nr:hypothetical protein M405DRAFT_828055 [Rhizopogon salebrosus TDB-379]
MEGTLAVTYSLIYAFLKKQAQTKAADAVKKAARNIIVLKDDLQLEGPQLDEIVKQWKELQAAGSSSESDSSDDSSDDSSSSSSSDSSSSSSESSSSSDEADSSSSESENDSKEDTQVRKKVHVTPPRAERDTSVTLSSDANAPKVKSRIPQKKPSTEESSESDSDSDDSTSESASNKKPVAKVLPKKAGDSSGSKSSSSGSESSSSSSASESPSDKKPVVKAVPKKDGATSDSESSSSSSESSDSESSSSSSSESESEAETKSLIKVKVASSKASIGGVASTPKEETQVAKKRKTSESGAAVVTAVAEISRSDSEQTPIKSKNIHKNGNNKPHRNANERFSRIKPQVIPPEQLLDNGYEAKGAIANDYGTRAHHDLIVTRGAGFRKEKNKKKRGSYRGGEITLQTHSIKFTD